MAKKSPIAKSKSLFYLFGVLIAIGLGLLVWHKNWQSKFDAPRQNTQTVQFTIGKNFTLDAVVGDLKYFDFIKNESAFKYALERSKDTTMGNDNSLKIGINTINREAVYTISQSMTAWELANVLVNQGNHISCDHGCPESNFNPELLPGGDLAPTIVQKYEWVKTYEDCAKSIGHDGGQLSSDQYAQKTGIRICTSPDGRYFVQGKEGYTDYPPYP